ncbi:hypothetical protein [Nostoc sp. LEGE 06077]|nr:hypothetical protein [Nostoc sp. LEGE 06077]
MGKVKHHAHFYLHLVINQPKAVKNKVAIALQKQAALKQLCQNFK